MIFREVVLNVKLYDNSALWWRVLFHVTNSLGLTLRKCIYFSYNKYQSYRVAGCRRFKWPTLYIEGPEIREPKYYSKKVSKN